MKKKNIFKSLFCIAIAVSCSAAGYYDTLPVLGEKTRPSVKNHNIKTIENKKENEFPDLSPKLKKPIQATIYKQGTYRYYLKDLEELLPYLEGIKKAIISNDESKIQLFCAKENLLSLYIEQLETKYKNKPERHYETYRQMVSLSTHLSDLSQYVRYVGKYNKLMLDYDERRRNSEILNKKFDIALTKVNYLLSVLKENLSEE